MLPFVLVFGECVLRPRQRYVVCIQSARMTNAETSSRCLAALRLAQATDFDMIGKDNPSPPAAPQPNSSPVR